MDCPQCGYAMGPFDAKCPRCSRSRPTRESFADDDLGIVLHPPAGNPSAGRSSSQPVYQPAAAPAIPPAVQWKPQKSPLDDFMMGYWWVLLLLFCPAAAVAVGIMGLVSCQHPVARRNAGAMLIITVALAALAFVVYMVMGAAMFGAAAMAASPQSGVTLAQYNQLYSGMSYQQAASIIGPGEELSHSDTPGYTTVMYMWRGSGQPGANMNAMFQNDRMISKSQFGLE